MSVRMTGAIGFLICLATVASIPQAAIALTCQERITELTTECMKGDLNKGPACRQQASQRLGSCRNWQGNMADFEGKAEEGRNPGDVYLSCAEKKRMGYVLEKNEVDYCGGLRRKD